MPRPPRHSPLGVRWDWPRSLNEESRGLCFRPTRGPVCKERHPARLRFSGSVGSSRGMCFALVLSSLRSSASSIQLWRRPDVASQRSQSSSVQGGDLEVALRTGQRLPDTSVRLSSAGPEHCAALRPGGSPGPPTSPLPAPPDPRAPAALSTARGLRRPPACFLCADACDDVRAGPGCRRPLSLVFCVFFTNLPHLLKR